MKLSSSVFKNGQYIPATFTSEGAGISPALNWEDAPTGTQSFALVMTDHDIPSPSLRWSKFIHWIVYDIPANQLSLPADFTGRESGFQYARIAPNGAGVRRYYPPCPVSGTHEYAFQLFALDVPRLEPANEKAEQVVKRITAHSLSTDELIGLYKCVKFSRWQALKWNCGMGIQHTINQKVEK